MILLAALLDVCRRSLTVRMQYPRLSELPVSRSLPN